MSWQAWGAAYVAALGVSAIAASVSPIAGNVAFVVGAALVLTSIVFFGVGGERRAKKVRDLMGVPVGEEPIDAAKRRRQVSTGLKVFLLGAALWAPLLWIAFR